MEAHREPTLALTPVPVGAAVPLPNLTAIYKEECSYVWNGLRRLGVQARDLEDLVHDVFVIVNRRLADFDCKRAIRPWLYGITLRVASDYRNSARNRHEVLSADIPESHTGSPRPDEELASEQNRDLIMEALEALDFKNRVIFVMHDINEHTLAEAAAELDVPMATLYSRLRVGREQFTAAARRIRRARGDA